MFGEQHPGQPPVMAPPNPDDPEAMLAYVQAQVASQAAWARYMQLAAAPPQHAFPMRAPSITMQQHPAFPMPPLPKKPAGASSSKRTPEPDTGSSLWTIIVCLVLGASIGYFCAGRDPQQQQPPQQQVR